MQLYTEDMEAKNKPAYLLLDSIERWQAKEISYYSLVSRLSSIIDLIEVVDEEVASRFWSKWCDLEEINADMVEERQDLIPIQYKAIVEKSVSSMKSMAKKALESDLLG